MDKFRNESSLDTWLYTVTRNFCLSRYRWKSANKRRGEIVDVSKALFLTDKTPSALEQAISQQILEEINKYLVKMPLHYQEVLLEFMRSNQRQQSAAILGISRKTFTCRLNRARTMLRKHMEKKGLI
jgi:RNA polymerase sigma-70 factor (ECF subfamily)